MKKRLRILHVGEYVQGGVATYIKLLTNHSQNEKIEDFLICSDYKSEHNWNLTNKYVTYYKYKRNILYIPKAILAIRQAIKDIKPDIIYCHSTWAGAFVRIPLLFMNRKCRVVYNAHGWAFLRDTAKWKKRLYALVERILLHVTDVVINVSQYEYNAAIKYRMPPDKLKVIYSGIDSAWGGIDSRIKLPGKINLLFVGRFDPQKGLDILIKAFANCSRKDIHLTIIGDNVVGRDFVRKENTERVSFLGWIPHEKLSSYYAQCDAILMPSRWEAFGLVAIEAMKYGKPVIASNRGALPELVKTGVNGYIFDIDNVGELTNLLDSMDKKKLDYMSEMCKKIFWRKFTQHEMLKKTIALYCDVL